MALKSGVVRTIAAAFPRIHTGNSADLHQLSAVTAFSVIGLCLSLMALNFTSEGEWLAAIVNGF